jgi:hypothetical protein
MKNTVTKATKIGSSAISKGKELTTNLPAWAKGVVFIGLAFVAYKVYKGVSKTVGKSKLNEESRDSIQEIEGWYKELTQENSSSSTKATLTPAAMKALANKIENCMDGYGTRDYDIKQAFKQIKNNADFAGVAAAFGTRTIQAGRGVGWLAGDARGTMVQMLQEEADSDTLDSINKSLGSRGIKYRV